MKNTPIMLAIVAVLIAASVYLTTNRQSADHSDSEQAAVESVLSSSKPETQTDARANSGPGLSQVNIGPGSEMRASDNPEQDEHAKEELAYTLGVQAYLYGIPALRLEEFRFGMNRLSAISKKNAPGLLSDAANDGVHFNELIHLRKLSTPELKLGLTPNNDTMYSPAFYDLAEGPLVLSVPQIADRYFSVQIVDAYLSNAAYVGTRSTGEDFGDYLLIGPDWEGRVPPDMVPIELPTNQGFLAIRILVDGPDDAENVIAIQNKFALQPLSASGPLIAAPKPDKSGELAEFRRIVELAQRNPPASEGDRAMWDSFQYIGMSLQHPFDADSLDPAIKRGLLRAIPETHKIVAWKVKFRGYKSHSQWNVDTRGGSYGADFLARAEGAIQGLVVHDAAEGMYFHTYHAGDGKSLHGDKKYVLHFDSESLPPVKAFWSLTAYDSDYNLVENEIQRYSIGDRTVGLEYEENGSLVLYVQSTPPDSGTANWLPTPAGERFRLNLRMYMPEDIMRDTQQLERFLPPMTEQAN